MQSLPLSPRKHILVCTNDREVGACCDKVGGYTVFRALKDYVRTHGLSGSVWVTRTGCLGFCNDVGTTVVIYPDCKWYNKVTDADLPRIIEELSA